MQENDTSGLNTIYFNKILINAKKYICKSVISILKKGCAGIPTDIIKSFLKTKKMDSGALYHEGEILCKQGYYAECTGLLEKVLACEPGNARAWQLAGFAFYQQGAFDIAVQYFDQALALDPRLPDAIVYKGLCYSNFGNHNLALSLYDQALAIHPAFIQAWYARGLTLAMLERYKDAVTAYEHVLVLDPEHADARIGIGIARKKCPVLQPKKSDSVVPAVQPDSPKDQRKPGIDLNQNPQAIPPAPGLGIAPFGPIVPEPVHTNPPTVPAAVVRPPNTVPDPKPSVPRCSSYSEMILELEALPKSAAETERLMALGLLYLKTGRYSDAVSSLASYLERDPGNADAWKTFGDAQKKAGGYYEALEAYDQALAISPSQPAVWINRAKTLVMLGQYDEAILSCDRAIALDHESVEAWLYKGFVFKKIRRNTDAIAAYDTVLLINPGHDQALRQLRHIREGA